MELYTVIRIEETSVPKLIKRTYAEKEIENFKKQAKGIYYHVLYTSKSEEDRYTIQIPGHDYDNSFLEIPVEDYVIENGVLVGCHPYSGKRLKENIRKMLTYNLNCAKISVYKMVILNLSELLYGH